jgi:hypothetical protein
MGVSVMTFKEELQKLSVQITERKKHITNEEMTKQALIIPFLQVLGYDVFNPLEVKPEYDSDFAKKKGEKVDYAIYKNDKPIIFIEAKVITENPTSHDAQLSRYFNATPEVKLAIITNGITYKFFTDLDTNNIMDDNPFAVIDITDLSSSDIEVLDKFRKEVFETETLVKYAEDLIYTTNLNNKLRELFKNPPDDFIRYLIKDFSDSRITSNVIERFRPIVKKSIQNALLDMVSQGLSQSSSSEEAVTEEIVEQDKKTEEETETKSKKEVTTTIDELKCFNLIKNILLDAGKNISEINYKDTASYFAIFNRNILYWFIRINLDSQNKFIITRLSVGKATQLAKEFKVEPEPKGLGESRLYISCAEDLIKLNELVVECFDDVTK